MNKNTNNSPSPLNVCFVIDQLRTGGTETFLLRLIDNLDQEIIRPHLCLLNGADPDSQKLEPSSCPVIRLNVKSLLSISSIGQVNKLRKALKTWKIDLLQVHFPDSTYFAVPVAKLAGVRRIVRTRRDLFYWVTPIHKRFGKRLDWIYNKLFVNRMLTNCRAVQDAACSDEGLSEKQVIVIENGIPIQPLLKLSHLKAEPILHRKSPISIGCVSMLRPEKRVDVFIEAASQIAGNHAGIKWSVAGGGPMRAELEALILKKELDNRIELNGVVADIPSFLGGLDIWVLCSESEGQSNALIEAMAAGRAIIATDVGGNSELINHGENGLLIPPNNPNALAEAMKRLIQDPILRVNLGNAARSTAKNRFSLEGMIQRYQQFYLDECGK